MKSKIVYFAVLGGALALPGYADKIQFSQLPAPAQNAVQSYLQGGEVNDVDRNVKDGQVTYEIGFKGPNGTGPQHELLVDSNGTVLRAPEGVSPIGVGSSPVNATGSSTASISYNDVPQSVKQVAQKYLNNGDVKQVQREIQNGQLNYEIGFQRENGGYQVMVISENGQIVSNRLFENSAAGAAAISQSGTGSSTTAPQANPYSYITTPVQIQNAATIQQGQLPVAVWRAVRRQAPGANISQIQRGNWAGKEIYQVTFTDTNGRLVPIQVDANGQVVYSPLGAGGQVNAANLIGNIGRALLNQPQQQ